VCVRERERVCVCVRERERERARQRERQGETAIQRLVNRGLRHPSLEEGAGKRCRDGHISWTEREMCYGV